MRWRPGPHLLVLVACLVAGALALVTTALPRPRPVTAPANVFSAERAAATIRALLGDGAPHPVGSPANDAVRERLVATLEGMGLEPELQRAFMCQPWGVCAWVTNVVVELPGAAEVPAIALSAHYDSVSAGPGAADDLQGVATLVEGLRALKELRGRDGPPHRPLVAVFTDGEEVGLLGALAFTEHPRFADVGVVINAEARGTGGRPQMFEASAGNHRLIGAVAQARHLPLTTSLAYEIYRRMPNDTDLSVFMRAGVQGLNFAFIGGVRRYHTPRDDLDHLDLGSVQLQGEAVLATARALLGDREPLDATVDAAYTDLFGELLLRWPAPAGVPLAGLTLLAVLIACVRAIRRGALRVPTALAGLALVPLCLALGAGGGFALLWLIAALSEPLGAFPAAPGPALLATTTAAATVAFALLRPLAWRVGAASLALAGGLWWAGLALAAALLLPGGSGLLLPPALVAAIGLVIASGREGGRAYLAVALLQGALTFAIFTPLLGALADALGTQGLVLGAAVGWMLTAALPALAARRGDRGLRCALVGLALVAAAAAIVSARSPRITVDQPARLNLLHITDLDAGAATLAAELDRHTAALPAAVAAAATWEAPRAALPWRTRTTPTAPAATLAADGPQLERRAADADDPDDPADASLTHLTLRAREGAAIAYVRLPEALISLRVAGRDLDPSALAKTRDGGRLLTIWGPPADGLAIDIAAADTTSMNAAWIVADARLGLPEGDRALAEARPPEVVPFQWGDLSVAYREVTPAALAPAPAPADADDCEGCRPTAELDPRRIDAFVDAACHQRYDEARAELLRFSPTDGDDPRTDAAFAGWVFMVGEKARAREILSALKGAPEAALEVATFTALFARTEGDCAAAKRADKRLMKLLDAAGDAPRPIAWIDFPLAKEIDARALAAWTHGRVLSCGRADPLPAYERALTYDPGFAQAHTQIGDLHFAKERDDAAAAAWRAAIAADPDHANAHSRLGDLLEFRCEFAEALPLLDRAWQLNPFDKGPLTRNLCFAYTRAGRYDDAARACRTYARANPYEDDADELAMMANLLIVAPQAPAATVRDLDAERCGAPPE